MEGFDAGLAAPRPLWWLLDLGHDAVHVVAAVAVVAEQQLEPIQHGSYGLESLSNAFGSYKFNILKFHGVALCACWTDVVL